MPSRCSRCGWRPGWTPRVDLAAGGDTHGPGPLVTLRNEDYGRSGGQERRHSVLAVRTDYERLADRYDEDRAGWSIPRDEVVDELLASRRSVRVLDLGCGTARWLVAQREAFG